MSDPNHKKVFNSIKRCLTSGNLNLSFGEVTKFPQEFVDYNELPVDQYGANSWSYYQIINVDFSGNNFTEIPLDFFMNNPEIINVILNSNKLIDFDYDLSCLQNIKKLTLDDNQLTNLKCLENTYSIVLFTANKNKIKKLSLPNARQFKLEKIEINNNIISEINSDFFNLITLKYLDLSHNNLLSIPSDLQNLTRLESLILTKNQIHNIDIGSMHLKNLKQLDISLNRLTSFELEYEMPMLDTLNLCFNQIKRVDCFSHLPSVTVIDIKNNAIEAINPDIRFCQKLTTLDLSNNNIKDLPNYLGMMGKLVRLGLEGNQLTRIRSSIRSSGTENIKKYLATRATEDEVNAYKNMDIAENNGVYSGKSVDKIEDNMRNTSGAEVNFVDTDLNQDFQKGIENFARQDKTYKSMEQFRFTNSNIYSVIYSASHTYEHKIIENVKKYDNMYAKGIAKLKLENCKLRLIPALVLSENVIKNNIRELILPKNKITVLDKIIFMLPNLTHLDLSYNELTDELMLQKNVGIEYKDLKCKYLHHFNISNNKGISKLPIFLNWTEHINTIYAANCNIDRVNELFLMRKRYDNLENIDLSYNQLVDLIHNNDISYKEMCGCLPMLKGLNLAYNKLKNIPLYIDELPSLDKLNLYANCIRLSKFDFSNCDTGELIKYVAEKNGGVKKDVISKESVVAIKVQDQIKEQIRTMEAEIKKMQTKLDNDLLLSRSEKYNIKMEIEDKKQNISMLRMKMDV